MGLFMTRAALGLCGCALLLAACSPQDGSSPVVNRAGSAATGGSSTSTAAATTTPAQAAKSAAGPQAATETRRISIEEMQKEVAAGRVVVVDVRDEDAYKASHIKGAKSIPLQQMDKRAGELPKDKLIVTYCA